MKFITAILQPVFWVIAFFVAMYRLFVPSEKNRAWIDANMRKVERPKP